uniref:Protein TBRG4 n=2 Tax=Lygus hesperus TaxID=30085 RepID=A0A0A9WMB6_LYGHE
MLRTASRRLAARIFQQVQRPSTSGPSAAAHSDKSDDGQKIVPETKPKNKKPLEETQSNENRSRLVTAAFASLKQGETQPKTTLDERILAAKDPEALLSISQSSVLSKKQILRIVTTLAEWSVNGQADMAKYETDSRFVSLCQMLGKTPKRPSPYTPSPNKTGDLSLVLGVTGDDEAARLISSITLPQMVKVMVSLAFKKRRSVPLLRALSYHISSSSTVLDIKQSADVIYALASLNFPDEVLLEKVCCDLLEVISKCQKTSVIGSISTSLGLLKYKDENLLDALVEWTIKNSQIVRFQDLMSLLLTLASVNHSPRSIEHFFKVVSPLLNSKETPSCNAWLDVVWSLAVVDYVQGEHLQSVLNPDFVEKLNSLSASSSNFAWKKKLLNLNGVAKHMHGYKGPFLDESSCILPLARTKDKLALVASVVDALSNLVPSGTYLRTDVDSGMGFFIDAECLIDEKMTPLPLVDKKTGQPIPSNKPKKGRKVAVMVWDYHDITKGKSSLCGSAALSSELLKKSGYQVLNISYKDYNFRDKLTDRVSFIEKQLRTLVVKE